MSSGFLPFDDDVEAPIVIRETVRLTPDTTDDETNTVPLKPDTTGDETNTVRLMPDTTEDGTTDPGSVRLQPDRDPVRDLPDAAARRHAVDPAQNVLLEASAGTGKTRVLVERYVNLLRAGVEPDHILAMTFTRKAAAEMRQRIVDRLKEASRTSEIDAARWREIKDRLGDIAISTIDAFCLSLLREFPLEADVDPGFDLAADTEVPRLIGASLDQALRICRGLARDDDDVALVFAQLGERRLRTGIAALLDRRLVAPAALRRFLQQGPRDLTAATACESAAVRLRDIFSGARDGVEAFLADGPCRHPQFAMLAADIRALCDRGQPARVAARESGGRPPFESGREFRAFIDRLRAYFLTQDGSPRGDKFMGTGFSAAECDTDDAWRRHRASAAQLAPLVADAIKGFRRDLNAVMSRGVWRIFAVALRQYQQTLDAHALLDFSGVLERAVRLLKEMDEFAESRLRLEARHRHVLVDEFQDTSRAQWELVRQLVKSWGEGFGAASDAIAPSIFVVGDRKQSIYGFRDADVAIVDEAAAFIQALRPDGAPRQAITVSFRSDPAILAFVNDVFTAIAQENAVARRDGFRYTDDDRFPIDAPVRRKADTTAEDGSDPGPVRRQPEGDPVQFLAAATVRECADQVADEIVRLLAGTTIRDRGTGVRRAARAADVAIL
ncbi:MAG TPA: UvrD-helicase domain-containing protein, partial [Vicinamibacterales bacterium]|nr:UvrD-helicase domain-containing protein [Vicinamibacterales bacterium]